MRTSKHAVDPLWQCLCPSWTQQTSRLPLRAGTVASRPALVCQNGPPQEQRTGCRRTQIRRLSSFGRKHQQDALGLLEAEDTEPYAFDTGFNQSRPVHERAQDNATHRRRDVNPQQRVHTGSIAEQSRSEAEAFDHSLPSASHTGETPLNPRFAHKNLRGQTTGHIHSLLRDSGLKGYGREARQVAEYLVRDRGVRPNLHIYNTLILANVSSEYGSAWRVQCLLEDMEREGLQMDAGTCHAVLKVLSVHLDHLLRSDVLEYMQSRWFQLTGDGKHDVAAGLLREGRLEQAVDMLDQMKAEDVKVEPWLLDMAVYALCAASEFDHAHKLMLARVDSGEPLVPRDLWAHLLDTASSARHHGATHLAWTTQVDSSTVNPSSGTCLAVLATAAQAGDAILATAVFSHLSKRSTPFSRIHYELLLSTYLSGPEPDLRRALSILTIMPLENLHPTTTTTRPLFTHLNAHSDQLPEALEILRDLHSQSRPIPSAALNLLLEIHVVHNNLFEALKLYKLMHTFAPTPPPNTKPSSSSSSTNPEPPNPQQQHQPTPSPRIPTIETFNLLLRACRRSTPPNATQASFLVSELLALKIRPTPLTYDRLILVFIAVARHCLLQLRTPTTKNTTPTTTTTTTTSEAAAAAAAADPFAQARQALEIALAHLADMSTPPLCWFPRGNSLVDLAKGLAGVGDPRCWDVLQVWEERARAGGDGEVAEGGGWGAAAREGDGGGSGAGWDGSGAGWDGNRARRVREGVEAAWVLGLRRAGRVDGRTGEGEGEGEGEDEGVEAGF